LTKRSVATLEDPSLIPGAGNNDVFITRSDWPTDYTTRAYISLTRWRHIYDELSMSIGQPRKTTFTDPHN